MLFPRVDARRPPHRSVGTAQPAPFPSLSRCRPRPSPAGCDRRQCRSYGLTQQGLPQCTRPTPQGRTPPSLRPRAQ